MKLRDIKPMSRLVERQMRLDPPLTRDLVVERALPVPMPGDRRPAAASSCCIVVISDIISVPPAMTKSSAPERICAAAR